MDVQAPFHIDRRRCECDKIQKSLLFTWTDTELEHDQDSGPDAEFFLANYFEAHVGLDYLEILSNAGSDVAIRWAVIHAVGIDGWKALRSPGMSSELFHQITAVILQRIIGSPNGPKA